MVVRKTLEKHAFYELIIRWFSVQVRAAPFDMNLHEQGASD